ncbi:transcriptional regulator [Vibrio profundi]|uniref:transcriptional regulator n=1 Tax=Vibrio profundi TaxID=1774960 RepID=UPI0037358632
MTQIVQISNLRIDTDSRDISNLDGNSIVLRPLSFEVLSHLIKHVGKCVPREEFFSVCWKGAIVSDQALTNVISNIRHIFTRLKALGVEVKTVTKIGYKLCVEPGAIPRLISEPPAVPSPVAVSKPNNNTIESANLDASAEAKKPWPSFVRIKARLERMLSSKVTSLVLISILVVGVLIHSAIALNNRVEFQDTSSYQKLVNDSQTLFIEDNSSANIASKLIQKALLDNKIDANRCGMTYLLRVYDSKYDRGSLNLSAFAFDKQKDDNSNYTHFSVTQDNLVPVLNDLISKANSLCAS